MRRLQDELTASNGWIFRITHRANLPWILEKGLHCSSSSEKHPDFVSIGNPDLISKRRSREVPISPFGTLDDYVPFYFTPFSPMMYKIQTGHGGIVKRSREEIVILMTSLRELEKHGVKYVFTDRHAYLEHAGFYSRSCDLDHVDFALLQTRDFRRDPKDFGKMERYQAEALVHRHVPITALKALACCTETVRAEINATVVELGIELRIVCREGWYL